MPTTTAVISDPAAKRRRRAKIYGLRTFMDPRCPTDFAGAFRDNVRRFVRECADVEERRTEGMPTWCTLLVDEDTGVVVPLYTVEECVRRSLRPFCDYCRCNGWSHHFVSRRRYHMIIPSDDDWDKPLHPNAFHLHSHLLHGLLHCNGFGHLLLLNGRHGGSHFLSGCLLMDLWDRLCSSLAVREVTVVDVSRKNSMELRLLLGVAYGAPWFARWGYRFRSGSFGIGEDSYSRALHHLSSLPLSSLLSDASSSKLSSHLDLLRDLRRILTTHRSLRRPTVRCLLRHLLHLKTQPSHDPPLILAPPPPPPPNKPSRRSDKPPPPRDFALVAAELASRWPVRRLNVAASVIVDALLEHGRMMTRQEVRDAARLTIGDTGLLDFVIKSLGNTVVGRHVVRRTSNPSTRVLEFTLDHFDHDHDHDVVVVDSTPPAAGTSASPHEVERDIAKVYEILVAVRPEEAGVVLNAKQWGKAWELRDEMDDRLRFWCQWVPSEAEMERLTSTTSRALPPPELVVVDPHASIGELKAAAEEAMRDTYCMMEEGFRVRGVEGLEGEDWEPVMLGGVESGGVVWVKGEGADMGCEMRYEGGGGTYWAVVGCGCGAREDDGERMVACDVCDVWHHTRCVGIDDGQPVPQLFVCSGCGSSILAAAADDEEEVFGVLGKSRRVKKGPVEFGG